MIEAGAVRKGNVVQYEGGLWLVLDTQVTSTGKRGAYTQIKMQSLDDQHIETRRFSTSDKIEKAFLEKRHMTYLYQDGAQYVFMDPESGEQIHLTQERLEDVIPYMAYNAQVDIDFHEGRAIAVELPTSVVLEVTKTEPAVRGDTATNVTKPAEVETGLTVKVPGHIREGETIRVDTRTGEFLGRA